MTNALTSLWNGSLTGKRQQEIFTPPSIIYRLMREWNGIGMDAAAAVLPWIPAEKQCAYPERDGLAAHWGDRTYCNPPYKNLRAWLEKAAFEFEEGGGRIALLCPVRSHRPWYRKARATCSARIVLNSITFYSPHPETSEMGPFVTLDKKSGKHRSTPFPAPLEILCWGWQPDLTLWAEIGDVE